MADIKFKIQGTYPPFAVELRVGSETGTVVDSLVAQSADTFYYFYGVSADIEYYLVGYDTTSGQDIVITGFTTTTTTTTSTTVLPATTSTTLSPTTTTSTTLSPTTTTSTTLSPTTTSTTAPPIGTPAPITTGDSYSTLNDAYSYPSFIIDFGASFAGKTSTTILDPAGSTPNNFTIRRYSDNGIALTSNWVGDAAYDGPWGIVPFSNPADPTYPLTLTERYYIFEVDTVTGPTYDDGWTWSIPAGV